MQPIVLGTQATPIADTLQQTITIAVMTGKGGVGKTWLAQLLAIFAVTHGITTKLIDLDGQPTLTAQFGHYTNGQLMRQLQIDPIRLTVQGLMLHPENGEEAMRLEYPLADVLINKLPVARACQ